MFFLVTFRKTDTKTALSCSEFLHIEDSILRNADVMIVYKSLKEVGGKRKVSASLLPSLLSCCLLGGWRNGCRKRTVTLDKTQ